MKTTKQKIKATPGEAIRMLSDYNECVFGLRETCRLALKNNLVNPSISGALKINLESVDKFYDVED